MDCPKLVWVKKGSIIPKPIHLSLASYPTVTSTTAEGKKALLNMFVKKGRCPDLEIKSNQKHVQHTAIPYPTTDHTLKAKGFAVRFLYPAQILARQNESSPRLSTVL